MQTRAKHPNRLARLREAQGLTQKELAALLPAVRKSREKTIDSRTVDRWEKGVTSIPDSRWHELADIFGVSVAHLLALDDDGGNGNGGLRQVA